MKKIMILLCFVHVSLSAPADMDDNSGPPPEGKVNYEVDLDGKGKIVYESDLADQSYSYSLETDDGTSKHEKGHFEGDNLIAEGGYEYIGEDGLKFSVVYVADEMGFRPMVTFGTKGGASKASPVARAIAPSELESITERTTSEKEPEEVTESQ